MLNKIFKSALIGAFIIFAISLNSCKKAEDTKAIITVVDVNGGGVENAKVVLHVTDPLAVQLGANVSNVQWTDGSGQTEHVFEHEAILNIDVSKRVGTNELMGSNVIRLLKHKTVSKTIEID